MDAEKDISTRFLNAYDQLSDAIFRHCYFRVHDREKALDLSQEAFAKTWEYLSAGKEIENLKAFIYKVANNLIIDASRRKTSLSLDGLMEDGFVPAAKTTAGIMTDAETAADAALLLQKLDHLDDGHREVILLRDIEGLSPKEIADIVGDSENAVSVRIHRGIKKLRDIIM